MARNIIRFPEESSPSQHPQKNQLKSEVVDIDMAFVEEAEREIIAVLNSLINLVGEWKKIHEEFCKLLALVERKGKSKQYQNFLRNKGKQYSISGEPSEDTKFYQNIENKRKQRREKFDSLIEEFNKADKQSYTFLTKYDSMKPPTMSAFVAKRTIGECNYGLMQFRGQLGLSSPDDFGNQNTIDDFLSRLTCLRNSFM